MTTDTPTDTPTPTKADQQGTKSGRQTSALHGLATAYRAAQFYAHFCHHACHGPTFMQDHSFFGELYSAYESAYDDLMERSIGLGGSPNYASITKDAADTFAGYAGDTKVQDMYQTVHDTELEIRHLIDSSLEGQSQGTTNFLQGLADESEQRTYKLAQRLKPKS